MSEQRRRSAVLIALVPAFLGVMAVSIAREEDSAPQEHAQVIARFVGVGAARLHARSSASDEKQEHGREVSYRCEWLEGDNRRAAYVVVNAKRSYVSSVVFDEASRKRAMELTNADALLVAASYAAEHYPAWGDHDALQFIRSQQRPPLSHFLLDQKRDGRYTGGRVLVSVDRSTGRVRGYAAFVPPPAPPAAGIGEADAVANAIAGAKQVTGVSPIKGEVRLYAASPLAPNEGPVWVVRFEWPSRRGRERPGLSGAIVDAVSGALLAPKLVQ